MNNEYCIVNEGIGRLDEYKKTTQVHSCNINKQTINTEQARHMTLSPGTQLKLLSFLSIIKLLIKYLTKHN